MKPKKLLFGLASLAVGAVFTAGYLEDHRDIAQVQLEGKAATIEPFANYTERTRKFITTYTADVRFKTAEGRLVQLAHKDLPSAVVDVAKRHRPVNILYMADEPTRARFPEESASLLVLGCGLLFLGAGIGMAVGAFRKEGPLPDGKRGT